MMYIDTSVIIRYLTGDDPTRSRAAAIVIEAPSIRAISVISLLEAAHVLRWDYHHDRGSIASALIDLVARSNVVVPEFLKEHVIRWLGAWRDGTADSIGDALIAASMSSTEAEAIATFDRRFPVGDWTILAGPAT